MATGTAPLTLTLSNNELSGSVAQANGTTNGFLSTGDWNIFNNKQNALTIGSISSGDITVSGGNGAVIGSGVNLTIIKANLTSADIAITGGYGSVLVSGTDLTINKGNLTESGSSVLTLAGGSNAVLGTGASIQVKQANTGQSGYLSNTDWNSFNNKVSSQWVTNGPDISFTVGKVAVGTATPAISAALEVNSTTSGLLLPRMSLDQRNAIAVPVEGLMVFCTDCGTNGALSIYSNSSWRSFSPVSMQAPSAATHTLTPGQIVWNWTTVTGAIGYKWNTTTIYGTATDVGYVTSKTETAIVCPSANTRYVWAYNAAGVSDPAPLFQAVSSVAPAAPVAAAHVATKTSITWNWNSVPDATGYKWNIVDDFATATEMGTSTTKSETGITCGTAYTRYVWAYNGCGYSISLSLAQSTLVCWICGDPVTRNHLASGGVAPVDKTVTYGTATNIPGELTKCWITRNLGAAQQATVVSDATEASAGWYFQFNRKQGYQWISSRIPATTWISSINESSNWISANDPCTLELGTGWRIPTSTEWTNVDASGGWTNWNGPFGSALKLHAAGNLSNSGGSLSSRGTDGRYWSSTQSDATNGWNLYFYVSYSNMYSDNKACGFSVRCVRDY